VSNIQYLGINENFPVAGQDNDTQVFRDNFDTIKNSLRVAQEEVENLQDTSAKKNESNDFAGNILQNAVTINVSQRKNSLQSLPLDGVDPGTPYEVSFKTADYHILSLNQDIILQFVELPGDPDLGVDSQSVGKMTLELYSGDGTEKTITINSVAGTVVKKDPAFPASLTVTSQTDPVFVEVWRHNSENIFMRYLGEYS